LVTSYARTCRSSRSATSHCRGFILYDRDDQVAAVPEQAGFTGPEIRIFGSPDQPMGRLALSVPAPGRIP
jgi:hypothetical protein